jgi:hypothetical protein
MNTPDNNKAQIKQDDRALKAALLLTRENLITAGKRYASIEARARKTLANAALELMKSFYDEGTAYANVVFDYDKDLAPVTAIALETAHPDAEKGTLRTKRALAKVFFLAGAHGVESDANTINELAAAYRDQLKAHGVIDAHANDGKQTRQPRPGTAKDEAPATSLPATSEQASQDNVAPVATPQTSEDIELHWKPGKPVTDKERRVAALVLTGGPAAARKLVLAIETHREQLLKWIDTILASDAVVQ